MNATERIWSDLSTNRSGELPTRAFYCAADGRYFLGAVAMVNSLRLAGHTERIVFHDCGLDERQRALLSREAEVLPATQANPPVPPFLQLGRGPLTRPAETMLILDADMIVTRSLEPVFLQAEKGQVVAVADLLSERFSDRWQAALRLPPLRRQTYVNTGLLALPFKAGTHLLRRFEESASAVDVERTFWTQGAADDPFFFLDQDILNALLASEFPRDLLAVLPYRLAPHPPFPGLVRGGQTLCVSYADETEPFALHHTMRKPWLDSVVPNLYTELMPHLLLAPDLPIRVPKEDVPRRLRHGVLGGVDRTRIRIGHRGRLAVRATRSMAARARSGLADKSDGSGDGQAAR